MSSEQIVLFDIPTKEPRSCWSFNTWKTRMVLNYKGLNYRTEWVEYPDIEPLLKPHVPPNPRHTPYTLPAIRVPGPTNTYLMDSKPIAQHLDSLYPPPLYPALHLDSPQLAKLESGLIRTALAPTVPVYMPRVHRLLLSDASVGFFRTTREENVGMTLEEYEAAHPAEKCWEEAGPGLKEISELLAEGQGQEGERGPFFMGGEVGYADFVWGGFLLFYKKMGVLEDLLGVCGRPEVHLRLLEGLEPWTRRDAE